MQKEQLTDNDTIRRMCDTMIHRGPDGVGYSLSQHYSAFSEEVAVLPSARPFQFGHRRLSIIDLSEAANQPMIDPTGNYVLVFNGEIYNHAELRGQLEREGIQFRTDHSDTEVLLNGLISEGKSFLDRVNGMFAFCFHDVRNDYFLMARDRLGIKPFYYTTINGLLYFASEVKALRMIPGFNSKPNASAVFDYLVFSAVQAPKTLFENTFKMRPGSFMELKDGQLSSQVKYWDLKNVGKRESTFSKEKEQLLWHFDQSAQRRMIADVEVGVLLSGGVDSTANLAMLTKHSQKPISAFTVGLKSDDNYTNEFAYARKAAKQFGAKYFELELEHEEFLADLKSVIGYLDMPIADTAAPMIYRIAKKAREEGITVLLGGEGSDELLIGYSYWSLAARYEQTISGSKSKASLFSSIHAAPVIKNKRTVYRDWYPKTKAGYTHFSGGTEVRAVDSARQLLGNDLQKELRDYHPLDSIQAQYKEFMSNSDFDYYDWMTWLDLNFRLPELLLARLDRSTMGASIEGRVPFLDHDFAEFCFSMPNSFKFKDGHEKYILKKAFEGILPNEILYRPKQGFPLPLEKLMMHGRESFNLLLDSKGSHGLLKPGHKVSGTNSGHQNYNLAVLSLWLDSL